MSKMRMARRLFSLLTSKQLLVVAEEIQNALHEKQRPVVSLESTIITHGLPYPQNVEMAASVEEVVRRNGGIPATCAFINGVPYVGLTGQQIEHLAEEASHKRVNKVSRRDIGYTMAKKIYGGTTISLTMILSHMAGIKVFGTGGLGGVHRDGQYTMDVSADLTELGRTPVAVVCAGPKSILDIGLTMEYLETQGVFVGTYNDSQVEPNTVQVPGFFCRESGVKSPYSFESFAEAAAIIDNSVNKMGLSNGSLLCIPPPKDIALSSEFIDEIIEQANREAIEKGISGKQLTPFLLNQIAIYTKGKSVECNVEFVKNNARCATEIAKELLKLETCSDSSEADITVTRQVVPGPVAPLVSNHISELVKPADLVSDVVDTLIIGSIALDSISTIKESEVIMQDSNPGSTRNSIGGVGYNISLANWYASKCIGKARLISFVGDDIQGRTILQELKEMRFDTSGISVIQNGQTAQYTSIHDDKGELVVACADMSLIEGDFVHFIKAQIKRALPKTIVVDCNLSPTTIKAIVDFIETENADTTVIVDPTSAVKCTKLAELAPHYVFPHNAIKLLTPTVKELERIYEAYYEKQLFADFDGWFPMLDSLGINAAFRERLFKYKQLKPLLEKGVLQQAFQLLPYFQNILVKLGADGALLVSILTDVTSYKLLPTTSPYAPAFVVTSEGRNIPEIGQMGVVLHYFPIPLEATDISIVNVTGAGDSMLGYLSTTLSEYNWLAPSIDSVEQEWMLWEAIYKSQLASSLTLQLEEAISPLIKQL